MSEQIEIPNKTFFKLNEVSNITGVKPYVLRFWETEFNFLINPENSENGQKLYEGKDIEMFLLIKKVLFDEKVPINDAKAKIAEYLNQDQSNPEVAVKQVKVTKAGLSEIDLNTIQEAKNSLQEIVRELKQLKLKI